MTTVQLAILACVFFYSLFIKLLTNADIKNIEKSKLEKLCESKNKGT